MCLTPKRMNIKNPTNFCDIRTFVGWSSELPYSSGNVPCFLGRVTFNLDRNWKGAFRKPLGNLKPYGKYWACRQS